MVKNIEIHNMMLSYPCSCFNEECTVQVMTFLSQFALLNLKESLITNADSKFCVIFLIYLEIEHGITPVHIKRSQVRISKLRCSSVPGLFLF